MGRSRLSAALVAGGKPEAFPTVRDDLESTGQSLKKICDTAVKTVPPNTKGVEEAVASAVVEEAIKPIVDWLGGEMGAADGARRARARNEEEPVGGRRNSRIRRYSRTIAAALFGLLALAFAPALAQEQGANTGTDL